MCFDEYFNFTGDLGLIEYDLWDPTGQETNYKYYQTLKNLESNMFSASENIIWQKYTWFGSHKKLNLHLSWTLSNDYNLNSNFKRGKSNSTKGSHFYVTTTPVLGEIKGSYIAQHNVSNGNVTGGNILKFYALDTVETKEGYLISVGFHNPKLTQFGERFAVYGVLDANPNVGNSSTDCIGCETFWYGKECNKECDCGVGYCDDGITGHGRCYCTMSSYGKTCEACDCSILTAITCFTCFTIT